MLEIFDLSVSYDLENKIIDNFSCVFETGKVYGLIGKNGIGKTTLFKSIVNCLSKQNGTVVLDGRDITNTDYLNIPITFISGTLLFFKELTVKDHMLLICNHYKYSKYDAEKEIFRLITNLKLEKYENYFPAALSKGTLKRVEIAIGLLRRNNTLLLDEPMNGLDPIQVKVIEKTIKENKMGKTILISSHDLNSLKNICDHYLIFKENSEIFILNSNEVSERDILNLLESDYE